MQTSKNIIPDCPIDDGDTAWMIMASVLVLGMIPGKLCPVDFCF